MSCQCHKFPSGLPSFKYLLKTSQEGFRKNLQPHLKLIKENIKTGISLYQCQECNRIWVADGITTGYSIRHCFWLLDVKDPVSWLSEPVNWREVEPIAAEAYRGFEKERQEYKERQFVKNLGPEIGPDTCKTEECDHLTIKKSVMCKEHHLIMLKRLHGGNLSFP